MDLVQNQALHSAVPVHAPAPAHISIPHGPVPAHAQTLAPVPAHVSLHGINPMHLAALGQTRTHLPTHTSPGVRLPAEPVTILHGHPTGGVVTHSSSVAHSLVPQPNVHVTTTSSAALQQQALVHQHPPQHHIPPPPHHQPLLQQQSRPPPPAHPHHQQAQSSSQAMQSRGNAYEYQGNMASSQPAPMVPIHAAVCNVKKNLSHEEILHLLKSTPAQQCTSWPPSGQKDGDVFVFAYEDEKRHWDFVADGMNWYNQGTRCVSQGDTVIKKRYYKRRVGKEAVDFRKSCFEISAICRVVIHYQGKVDKVLAEAPHGNRKKDLDRGHVRVMPSLLAEIKEQREGKVDEVYTKMISECRGPPGSFKVAIPRNVKQIVNRRRYEQTHETVHRCNVPEVSTLLHCNMEFRGFVKHLSTLPTLEIVFVDDQLVHEWALIVNSGRQSLMSYVTKAKFRDMFLTALIVKHFQFDCEPGIPLAYMIHHKNVTSSYKVLLKTVKSIIPVINSNNVFLIVEKINSATTKAWTEVMTESPYFVCWQSIRKSVIQQLKRLKVWGKQKKMYIDDITTLLLSHDENEFVATYNHIKSSWMPEYSLLFETKMFHEIKQTIRGKLMLHHVYVPEHGVQLIECDGLNTFVSKLPSWKDPPLESMAFALYMLSGYYIKNVVSGLCARGIWHLKPEFSLARRFCTDEEILKQIPPTVSDPADIILLAQQRSPAAT